jgi:hypothetical protein
MARLPHWAQPHCSPDRLTPLTSAIAGGLYEGKLLHEAVRRYECVWLPLLRRHVQGLGSNCGDRATFASVPPLDVAYVWHVHRLDPNYPDYCRQALNSVVVPASPFAFATTNASPLWTPDEQFYPPRLGMTHTPSWNRPVVDGSLEPHLQAAVKRQASFGHMFLRLCYQDRAYLEQVRPAACRFPSSAEAAKTPSSHAVI